jgi:hypothetical protein
MLAMHPVATTYDSYDRVATVTPHELCTYGATHHGATNTGGADAAHAHAGMRCIIARAEVSVRPRDARVCTPIVSRSHSISLTEDQHVKAWNQRGLSARAYAALHGLKPQSLHDRRRRARRRADGLEAPHVVSVLPTPTAPCEIVFPNERTLRFSETIELALLRVLRHAVEAS